MAIITLTTDMGLRDHYVAAVKGAILSQHPEAVIVDVSHMITPFDNAHAAFVLRNAYPEFPRGSIHIIGVNPEVDGRNRHMVVRHDGHYFVGADNGLFPLLFDGRPHEAFELTMKLDTDPNDFPVKNVFVKAACHLARNGTPEVIGRKTVEINEQIGFRPVVLGDAVKGAVVYIDGYGNVVTNITRAHFDEVIKGRSFRISFGRSMHDITTVSKTYHDVPAGERVAFFGMNGLLEIAVNKGVAGAGGGAAQLLGLRVADTVRLELVAVPRTVAVG